MPAPPKFIQPYLYTFTRLLKSRARMADTSRRGPLLRLVRPAIDMETFERIS